MYLYLFQCTHTLTSIWNCSFRRGVPRKTRMQKAAEANYNQERAIHSAECSICSFRFNCCYCCWCCCCWCYCSCCCDRLCAITYAMRNYFHCAKFSILHFRLRRTLFTSFTAIFFVLYVFPLSFISFFYFTFVLLFLSRCTFCFSHTHTHINRGRSKKLNGKTKKPVEESEKIKRTSDVFIYFYFLFYYVRLSCRWLLFFT